MLTNKTVPSGEIHKLYKMLTDAKIPCEMHRLYDGWQICYPDRPPYICDVVELTGSYGSDKDLLEIMGLTENGNEVEGWLKADAIFERIKKHYDSLNDEDNKIEKAYKALGYDEAMSFVEFRRKLIRGEIPEVRKDESWLMSRFMKLE